MGQRVLLLQEPAQYNLINSFMFHTDQKRFTIFGTDYYLILYIFFYLPKK